MFLSSEYHRTICLVMLFLLLFLILYFLWVFYFILFMGFLFYTFLWVFYFILFMGFSYFFILLCNLAFPITLRLFAHSGLVSGFYIFHFWLRWGFVLECPGEVLGLILQIKCGFFKKWVFTQVVRCLGRKQSNQE